ncbi:hypothetical protein QJQ45_013010, partial [Haematococcus lacustris]
MHNVWDVVEAGPLAAPPALAADATPAQQNAHNAQLARVAADATANLKARNIILQFVSNQHARDVAAAPTAKQAWDQLSAEFVQVSVARQSQLQTQLSQLRMQPEESVAQFFSRTMLLRDELASAGCATTEHSLMLAVLNAMPPDFKLSTQMLRYQLTLGAAQLDAVKKVLLQAEADLQQEQQLQPGPSLFGSSFTYTRGRGTPPGSRGRSSHSGFRGGYTAGRGGVIPTASRGGASQQRSSRPPHSTNSSTVCQYCHNPGHTLSTCFKYERDHRGFARPVSPSSRARWSPQRPRSSSPTGRGGGAGGRPTATAASNPADPEQTNVLFMVRQTPQFPKLSRTEPVATPVPDHIADAMQMTDEQHLDFYSRLPRWVIDSGANKHVMPWRSCLSDYRSFNPPIQLQLGGSGSSISVLGQGTTYLTNSRGDQWKVTGVLHAPQAAHCYLSVSELTRAGVSLRFQQDSCELLGPGDPPQWSMRISRAAPGVYLWYINAVPHSNVPSSSDDDDHLYDPDAVCTPIPHAFRMQANELDPQVWHQRCGHASFSVLTRMQREGMVYGVQVSKTDFAAAACSSAVCPGCAMGKQHRRVHFDLPTNAPPVTAALGLVHMDVCGPMPHRGRDGSRYIATFLDEHTGLSVIQLLTSKDQVTAAVQRVITELETQSGQRCKALRSDNGTEYTNKALRDWCSSKGIQQQFSAPYCPEQNGKAERLNRTLMQGTRSMLLTAQLPPGFWVDAALKANYVRNLLPITGQSLTPWEAFYQRKPDLSALRVFGATAWVYVTQPNRHKLQPKAVKGIFLGYAVGSKAYKLWVGGKLVVSKDVQIDETAVLQNHLQMQQPVQASMTATPSPTAPAYLTTIPPPAPDMQPPAQQQHQQQDSDRRS